ncbi:SusD family protein [compost metagenome]
MPIFQGISNNLLYYIRSECNARLGNLDAARSDLNLIFKYRYKTGTAPVVAESNKEALIHLILSERTKEFPRVSNIWWEDLRRLNLESSYQRTLTRTVNNKEYSLPPNDPRYVFPIPNNEIKLSGIELNQR